MTTNIELNDLERKAVATPLWLACANALWELNKARDNKRPQEIVEYWQLQFTALDKLCEALNVQ